MAFADRPRAQRELLLAALTLLAGLIIMPAFIFLTGRLTLGAYGPNAGFGTFLKDFYAGLLQGALPMWGVVLGPYLLLSLLRLTLSIHRRLRT